ncbi:MAG: DUF3800 domain-containing protein [Candidatus Omnitrophica bacterium]|nr:DUF3800 domain-containing protein [Candidatus Omnitrophota bacterium]
MLFFIDESWQTTHDRKYKAGVLAALQVKSHDFNKCSLDIRALKIAHLGYKAGTIELKGRGALRSYLFGLESKGVRSRELDLVRAVLRHMGTLGTTAFASVTFAKEEIDLACADTDHLDRPFYYLFERINLFMKEHHPGLVAKLVFDDRGLQTNERISSAVSNFFHKSQTGQSFDRILKVPFFAISRENIGIQVADIVAYVLGSRFTGSHKEYEFFKLVKAMEFKSRTTRLVGQRQLAWLGFKVIKEKGAGDLLVPVGTSKPMGEPEGSPPTPRL